MIRLVYKMSKNRNVDVTKPKDVKKKSSQIQTRGWLFDKEAQNDFLFRFRPHTWSVRQVNFFLFSLQLTNNKTASLPTDRKTKFVLFKNESTINISYQRCPLYMVLDSVTWTAHTNRILTPVWILHSCLFLSLISSSEASERLLCVPIMHCVLLKEPTENVWLFTRSSVCYGTNQRKANGPHSLFSFGSECGSYYLLSGTRVLTKLLFRQTQWEGRGHELRSGSSHTEWWCQCSPVYRNT